MPAWIRIAKEIIPKFSQVGNIKVTDVLSWFKVMQLVPEGPGAGIYEAEYEVKDRNDLIVTFTRCRTLEFFEKKAPERIVPFCQVGEKFGMEQYIWPFLPGAQVVPLKLPPRESVNDIACKWEFKWQPKI